MPIKPKNRGRYPKNWAEIRARILARAGNRCEGSPDYPNCRAKNGEWHPETGSQVVLTVAHLDHTPEHCADDNLRAWCQRCHLRYDAKHHAQQAALTRRQYKMTPDLFSSCDPRDEYERNDQLSERLSF